MYNNKLLIPTYTGTYTEIFLNACCTHKNCRFGEVSFLAPVYKSSRISATQRPIRNKFGTNVEKGRLVRNPQKNWKFFVPTYGPFPRGRSHIFSPVSFAADTSGAGTTSQSPGLGRLRPDFFSLLFRAFLRSCVRLIQW